MNFVLREVIKANTIWYWGNAADTEHVLGRDHMGHFTQI